jgi:hypothetical protein
MISASRKLGIASVPAIGGLAVAFGLFRLAAGIEWESVTVETVLTIGLFLPVSLVVARISARSFLATGSSNLLLLGLAVFEFGFGRYSADSSATSVLMKGEQCTFSVR